MMWKFLLAVTIAGVAAENSQSTCTPKQQKFCPAGASNLGNTCQNDCTGCTGFTGQIQSFVPGSNHRRFVPCLKTGTPPSQKVCSYFGALLVFCPASASAQQSTCQNHCSGCTGFTVDGNTCQADGTPPSQTTCRNNEQVFCPASASAQQSTCQDHCRGCTGFTVDGNTCQTTDTPPSQTMCHNNEQKFVGNKCQSCAAIDPAKSKWLQSSTSCVACLGTVQGYAAGCTGTDVCSLKTPNTCVVVGSSDGTCAAIDAAKPKWLASGGGSCVACLVNDDCAGNSGTDVCSLKTPNTCVVVGSSDATCAAIDAAKPKWLQSSTSCVACLGSDAAGCSGTDVCSLKTPNTCVVVGSSDGTCAAIDAAKPKFTNPKYCGDGSPPITDGAKMCGAGTTYDKTKKKCETILPTDIELAKMCGEGTTFDKAKKKCITDPTSRCTTNAAAAKESAGSRTATLTTSVITATMLVLVVIPLYQLRWHSGFFALFMTKDQE